MKKYIIIIICLISVCIAEDFKIIGYYAGNKENIDKYQLEKLTHIIYSFVHLDGNNLKIDNDKDEATIKHIVGLKKDYPNLKVMIALGGWGGCYSCSDVFSTIKGIEEFALSAKNLLEKHQLDGLDLDWEYPAIEGVPGHPFIPEDKHNFTLLIQELRKQFGNDYKLSFAAGGFNEYLEKSIEWELVMPLVDWVNLMSYDLVNGYSKVTGHHTPLYSRIGQKVSVESGVNYLDSLNIPLKKIVIGAAFYGRMWKNVDDINHGFFQPGEYSGAASYQSICERFPEDDGYIEFFDSTASAYYRYNSDKKFFITYDNHQSIKAKTKYAMTKKLGGIMFWQLAEDKAENGLLDSIHKTKNP